MTNGSFFLGFCPASSAIDNHSHYYMITDRYLFDKSL